MASPEVIGGDLIIVDNVRKGRVVARAMYNDGRDVFARMVAVFDIHKKRVSTDSFYFIVPANFPGLKRANRPQNKVQDRLPDF